MSTDHSSRANEANNQQAKPIPKSHELLIKNTFSSLHSSNNSDEKVDDEKKETLKKRVHEAGEILLFPEGKKGILRTIAYNLAKKTYCYKMRYTGDNKEYFVKIFEDSQMSPTKISKKLFTDKKLQRQLEKYLLLPAFKPQKIPLDIHTYEVVIYPFVKHCNLQDITLKALRQQYINPLYHTTSPQGKPHTAGYKMRLLKKFKNIMNIAIVMKNNGNGYVDMDISPDNFIITTELDDAADNDKIRWDEITDNKKAKCIKIDHESMIKWAEKFKCVEKPMKNSFKPPEVNSKDEFDNEFKSFDVEKASVYQFGATFVYVLYGQLKDTDDEGNVYWKSLPRGGKGGWKNANWNPKYLDLDWLQKCIDNRPHVRPSYNELLGWIEKELDEFKPPSKSKSSNSIGQGSSNRHRHKRNDLNSNQPRAAYSNNNGQVTIIYNRESLQRMRTHGQHTQYIHHNSQQQQQRPRAQYTQAQQQYIHNPQQQQQQRIAMRNAQRPQRSAMQQQQFMNPQQQQRMLLQQQQQQQRQQQSQRMRRAQPNPQNVQNVQNIQTQKRRTNNFNNNFNDNRRRKSGNNRRNPF